MEKNLQKIKAIGIISTFSIEERKEFKKFLASPYFNSNKNLCEIYDVILQNEDKINNNQISEEEIYIKVFKSEKFSYSSMRNQMSLLLKLSEEFILINSSRKNSEYKFENDMRLLDQYSKRFLDNNYHLKFNTTDKKLNYQSLGSKYFEFKSKLDLNYSDFESVRIDSGKRKIAIYNSTIHNICSVFSLISKDLFALNYLNKSYNYKLKVNSPESLLKNLNLTKFLDEIKSIDEINYNYIKTEIKFINLILQPANFENYYLLKKEIFKNINKFSNSQKYYNTVRLFLFLTNHQKSGDQNITSEISEFRKFQLKNIKYGKEGVQSLPMRIFMDMLNTFLITENVNFIESFVKDNLSKVESVNRKNAYNYSMARIELLKNNFENAIEYLSKLRLSENHLKLYSKMLVIQSFYELQNFESGLNALDSLKHFMKNNDNLTSDLKGRFNYLISMIDRIYKIRLKPENFSLFDIEKLFIDSKKLKSVNINWYERKTEDLRKQYFAKGKLFKTA